MADLEVDDPEVSTRPYFAATSFSKYWETRQIMGILEGGALRAQVHGL